MDAPYCKQQINFRDIPILCVGQTLAEAQLNLFSNTHVSESMFNYEVIIKVWYPFVHIGWHRGVPILFVSLLKLQIFVSLCQL